MKYLDQLANNPDDVRVESFTATVHWTHDDPGFARPAHVCFPLTERGRLLLASIVLNDHSWDWMESYRKTFGIPERHAVMVSAPEASNALMRILLNPSVVSITFVARQSEEDWKAFESWINAGREKAKAEPVAP